MALIEVTGTVFNFATRKSATGNNFITFSLSEGNKQKDGTYLNTNYQIACFNSGLPHLADKTRVFVKGWFKVGKPFTKKNGDTDKALEITLTHYKFGKEDDWEELGGKLGNVSNNNPNLWNGSNDDDIPF